MKDILALIPKNMLAFLAITLGIFAIIWLSPPHSICDSQVEVVNDHQQRFLYKDPKSQKLTQTKYELLRDQCRHTNDPGGCYELFQELKIMLRDLNTLPTNCNGSVADTAEYKRAITESLELMMRLAWGENPPSNYTAKFGWLDVADVSLYCRIKDKYIAYYGESAFEQFRERMMHELPGADKIPRNQVWDLSLFSENCNKYP